MKLAHLADQLIKPTSNIEAVIKEKGVTDDIVKTILIADRLSAGFTEKLAVYLVGDTDRATLENVFSFVKENIEYVIDKPGFEVVKSPGKTWKDGFADCKSLSILVGSILQNLKIPYHYRFTSYNKSKRVTHVYIVAQLNGQEVILDTVHDFFDEEVPYKYAIDYNPVTGQVKKEQKGGGIAGFTREIEKIGILFVGMVLLAFTYDPD
jgi:hypothetical protein